MERYVLLLKASGAGATQMLWTGKAGAEGLRTQVERIGGEVHSLIPVTGSYDLVLDAALPSHVALFALSQVLNAGGLYAEPLRAISEQEIDQAKELFPELQAARAELEKYEAQYLAELKEYEEQHPQERPETAEAKGSDGSLS